MPFKKKDLYKPSKTGLSKMNKLAKELNIDETLTTRVKYEPMPKVKNQTFPKHGYNEMADLLILPQTSKGFQYLLVMVDLWSNNFDIQEMKTKTAKSTLEAMQQIFKRNYIDKPNASLQTDNGGEFKDIFDKWLKDHDVTHLLTLPDRHKQMGNVESLNRQLGRLFNGYMNTMTKKTGKVYKEWTDILGKVRTGLNKVRKHPKDEDPYTLPIAPIRIINPPKYKVTDLVYPKLEKPKNELGQDVTGGFREGDFRFDHKVPRKIKFVLVYTSPNPYRYLLEGVPNVSYAESELRPAVNETQEKYVVRQIIDKRTQNKKIQYLVWWRKYLKKDSTWEDKSKLLEDNLQDYINAYEMSLKEKAPKTK